MIFLKKLLKFFVISSTVLSISSEKYLDTLVLPISFLSNSGRQITPVCNTVDLTSLLFDNTNNFNSVLKESSNDTVSLSKDKITVLNVNNNRYASSLGCVVDAYYNEAKAYYNSLGSLPNFDSYDLKILIIPTSAGGGSCARSQYYSRNTYSLIRKCDLPTLSKAIFTSFGLSIAKIENNKDDKNQDLSDPMGIGEAYTKVMLLNPLNRLKLGWIGNNSIKIYDTKSTHTISSASLKYPSYPIMIKGPKTNEITTDYYWVSYRSNSTTTSDINLPDDYVNCVFVHKTNILQKKLCNLGEEFINAESNTRIILKSKANIFSKINFLKCVQVQPTVKVKFFNNMIAFSIYNNNNKYCDFMTTYKAVINNIPIGYNIDSIDKNSRKISVRLVLDLNPLEVSFQFSNKSGILFSRPIMSLYSGLYTFIYNGEIDSLITFQIFDQGGDGICCQYGGGSYYELLIGDTVIYKGGEFKYSETITFTNSPVIIFQNLYPQQLVWSKNLTLFKPLPNSFTRINVKVASLNSKNGYGIQILTVFNYSFTI